MAFLTIKLWPANWNFWGKADVVELKEAISLSLNVEPGELIAAWKRSGENFNFMPPDEKAMYYERVRLSRSHLGRALKTAGPGPVDAKEELDTDVHLADFAAFAKVMEWGLPPQFPGSEGRSSFMMRTPEGMVIADPSGKLELANWGVWRHKVEAELWQVVAVSLDISPDDSVLESARDIFPDQFRKRLRDSVTLLGDKLPIAGVANWPAPRDNREFAAQVMVGPPPPEMNTVYLTAFAEFADEMEWTLPKEFPRRPSNLTLPQTIDATDDRSDPGAIKPRKPDPRMHNKLLTMVAAMAHASYNVDSLVEAADEIAKDAKRIGMKLDPRTAAKYLKEAADLVADKANRDDD